MKWNNIWGRCTLSKPEIHHRSSSQTSWHRFARQRGSIQHPSEKKCNHFGKLLSGACTTNLTTKNWDIGFTETFAQFIHYSSGISWEPRLNQSRYFTLSNYSTSVLEKSINYIIMITSQEDKDKEKYRLSKQSECRKILTKIKCCGAKYSHNMTWKCHSWYYCY